MGKRKPILPYMEPADLVNQYVRIAQPAPHPHTGQWTRKGVVLTDPSLSPWRQCPLCETRNVLASTAENDDLREHLRVSHSLRLEPSDYTVAHEAGAALQGAIFWRVRQKPTPRDAESIRYDRSRMPDWSDPAWKTHRESHFLHCVGKDAEAEWRELQAEIEQACRFAWVQSWASDNLANLIRAGFKAQAHNWDGGRRYSGGSYFYMDKIVQEILFGLAMDPRTVDEFFQIADEWLAGVRQTRTEGT